MRSQKLAVLILSLSVAGAAVAGAAPHLTLSASISGRLEPSPTGKLQERFVLPADLLERLASAPERSALRIESWPVAPGSRSAVTLRRHRVVHPSAQRILVTPDQGEIILPPSDRIHLWGEIEGGDGRIMLSVDATGSRLRGLVVTPAALYEIVPDGPDHVVVEAGERAEADGALLQPWTCALDGTDGLLLPPPAAGPGGTLRGESSGRTATIAFDTDTELMQLKFNNNGTAALDYIADLVAAMNVMYERDLDVTLLQGHTILRIGSDPYSQNSGGAASGAELNEFSSYWSSHYNTVNRALAAMLSGKSPSPNQASGIAWVGGLCSQAYGYSFTKVFRVDYLAGDAFVLGHELGHNFGSRHTHCYSPPIDQCYSGEGGCYSGTTSCPGGPGTVMSYCHVAGCGSNLMRFHDRVITNILNNFVAPATGVCIFASGGGEPLFDDGFESGDAGDWSATGP